MLTRNIVITLTGSLILVVTFMTGCSPEYQVDVQVNPGEAVNIVGTGTYEQGEEVILETEPEEGYEFVKWTEDGEEISTSDKHEFEIKEDRELTAEFIKTHEVTVEIEPEEAGNVIGEGTYKEEDLAELKAIAEDWYDFENWMNQEGEILEEDETLELEVADDKEIVANFKDKISVEESEKAEWALEEIKEIAEEAFRIFTEDVSITLFSEDSLKEIRESNNYPNFGIHQDLDWVGPEDLGFVGDIELEKIVESEEEVQVTALMEHPKPSNENIETIQREVINKVGSQAGEIPVSLRSLFIGLLEDLDLELEKTEKTLEIKEVDNELKVTSMGELEQPFSSLNELYEKAVTDQVKEVVITTEETDTETNYDEYTLNRVLTTFEGELEIELESEIITGISTIVDPYLLDKTIITLPSESEMSLNAILNPLEEKLESSNPEANMMDIKITDMFEQEIMNFLIVYQAKNDKNEVLGYLDSNKQDVNIIRDVDGVIDDYIWSPQGNYVAYVRELWTGGKTGSKTLDIYDTDKDKVIRVTDLVEFEEEYEELKIDTEQPEFNVNFQDLEWDKKGETLYFKVTCDEEINSGDTKPTYWKFNVKEQRLFKINN